MTDAEKLIALGVPTQLAPELVKMMAGGISPEQYADLLARIAAVEASLDGAIVTDEAP